MVISAISQMMSDVDWGELDILLIDTPPGTGDAQLTLAQKIALTGAVIVSTPQTVALADVRRGISLFEKTQVPVLGLVENMAWFEDPKSGERSYIFGKGGVEALAGQLGLPFLGAVPLVNDIREGGDTGHPVAADTSSSAGYFSQLADALLANLAASSPKPAPVIIFE
jgi:ATP-binding protein involved in chromosome partitioning